MNSLPSIGSWISFSTSSVAGIRTGETCGRARDRSDNRNGIWPTGSCDCDLFQTYFAVAQTSLCSHVACARSGRKRVWKCSFALAVVLTPIVVTREVARMVHAEHRNGTGDLALAVLNQAAVEEGAGGYVPTDLGFFSTF
jgi:hypothetical protein